MIKEFKIHSNYLIEGANTKVSWKTKDAIFIKFHIDSWSKGWLKNNDSIELNLSRNLKKITLYAIGFEKIEKKEIYLKLNKFKESTIRGKKIEKIDFTTKKFLINTKTTFNLINNQNGLKNKIVKINNKEFKPKINYQNLKLENHE